ncbi:PREDICTED: UPF0587 protein C1orf123 homolog [Ceratosolen solmsi marchali]|uniref:UPF0587 protein C1orf123 homolog n=1 Tax=Ceratosolen solmsi marchali TaxID=326594 RepID=A0AAJ7DWK0_9HYME|nr:PREDICTED: UPF0587 protein C1orf123 homolog [Ceratosolen solmsi marchali]
MVKIALQLKANLENVESLSPSSDPHFRWYLKFACNNCGEVSSKWNYASLAEETSKQRGSAVNHFFNKCKFCSRENSLTILSDTIAGIKANSCNELKTIVVFDCRGLEPREFVAKDGWVVETANNGKIFKDVDLSEGEWVDYCDKIGQPVGVYELKHSFKKIK